MMFVFCRKRPMPLERLFSPRSASTSNSRDSRPALWYEEAHNQPAAPAARTTSREEAREPNAHQAGDVEAVLVVVIER